MIKTNAKILKPHDIEVTIMTTMPLREWITVREQIYAGREGCPYPLNVISSQIANVVREVEQVFEDEE